MLGLYGFLSVWAIRVASQAKDRFGAALAVGVGAMIFWHAFFNLGMVLGLLPVVGVHAAAVLVRRLERAHDDDRHRRC